jgi:hypothetical protein
MEGRNLWGLWGGLILIGLGLIFLVGQFLRINVWGYIWPLFIIGAGMAFFVGMFAGGKSTGALAVPGSVFVTIGSILFVQNLFNIWGTWAYAWTLIIVGAGIGLLIFGKRSQIPEMRGISRIVIIVGLAFFFIFGMFFELGAALLGMRSLGGIIWPLALILLGLYVLIGRNLFRIDRGPVSRSETTFNQTRRVDTAEAAYAPVPPVVEPPVSEQSLTGGQARVYDPSVGYEPPAAYDPGIENRPLEDRPAALHSAAVPGGAALASVQRVRFRAMGDMTIIQGEREGLEIEASEEVKERIISEVHGSELDIRLDENWFDWLNPRYWNFGPVRYTVYVRDLESLEVGGVGNIVIPNLITRRFDLHLSATGNVSVRSLQAADLNVRLSGLGNIDIDGRIERQEVDLTGAGSYHGERLESRSARVRLSGLGNAAVWVTEDLDARVSGAGNVEYFGSPRVNQHVSGLGNVIRKGDR